MLFQLFIISLVYSSCIAKEEDVLEFSDNDFDSRIAEHETALVMFYAPWCGHCKRLKPEYAKAAEDLIRNDPPIALVKIDCTEAGKETCNKNSVSGYPTLKIFRNGEFSQDYNGPREASGIVKYMKAQVGPSSKELKGIEDLEILLAREKEPVIIGFFEKETDLKGVFLKLADKLREKVKFAHTSYKDLIEQQDLTDGVVLFRPYYLKNKFEDNFVVYKGKAESSDLNDFISNNYHGLVGIRTSSNLKEFPSPVVVAYYDVDYIKNPKGSNYWRNRVLKVAKEYKGKVTFAVSAKDDFTHELNEFGVDFAKGDKPLVTGRDAKERKFVMKEEFSVENLEAFVKNLIEDKLEPYIKSDPIPENNDAPVKIAVANNFDDIVVNNGKDTLIEFYAPWCGHCKKLAPAYDELAEKLKDEDVVIAKLDATTNDVPHSYEVRGFPTLYWAPKDSKDSPIKYEGGREVDDFIKYISKHATKELKGYDRKGERKADKTEL